jgi:hypothetical protein
MNHSEFAARKTAAVYVANALDERWKEAFEAHLKSCADCVEEVGRWLSIKQATPRRSPRLSSVDWPIAAAFVSALIVGAAGAWRHEASAGAAFRSNRTVVTSLSSVSSGTSECGAVRLAPETQMAVVQIETNYAGPIVARDSERRELPTGKYHSRGQPDGSQVVSIDAHLLAGRAVHLGGHRSDGAEMPIGCITGEISTSH